MVLAVKGLGKLSCMYLIFPETRVTVLHFCRWRMGLSLFNFLWGAAKNASFLHYSRMFIGRSRSSKVDGFGTNQKRVCDFLLVRHRNLNLGLIFRRFW